MKQKTFRVRIEKFTHPNAWYKNEITNEYVVTNDDIQTSYWRINSKEFGDKNAFILKSDCVVLPEEKLGDEMEALRLTEAEKEGIVESNPEITDAQFEIECEKLILSKFRPLIEKKDNAYGELMQSYFDALVEIKGKGFENDSLKAEVKRLTERISYFENLPDNDDQI